jgi:hypothetical protein
MSLYLRSKTGDIESRQIFQRIQNKFNKLFAEIAAKFVFGEVATPATDGSTVLFNTSNSYRSGTLVVHRDGIALFDGNGLTETSASSGTYTLDDAPDSNEVLRNSYVKV